METTYYEAVEKFYILKNLYEKKRENLVKKIIKNKELNKKEKIKRIRKLKTPCISCKKQVNSIFEIKDDKYIAQCGDPNSKCKLNIEIEKQLTIKMNNKLDELINLINEDTYHIIKLKLALLFGFINEEQLEEIYDSVKQEYKDNQLQFSELQRKILDNENLEERYKNIKDLNEENYDLIKTIKGSIARFLIEQNNSYVSDIMDIYVDNLYPNIETLRENKYRVMHIENINNKIYLIQKENSLQDNEKIIKQGNIISYSY